jgi:hypothetical protein
MGWGVNNVCYYYEELISRPLAPPPLPTFVLDSASVHLPLLATAIVVVVVVVIIVVAVCMCSSEECTDICIESYTRLLL